MIFFVYCIVSLLHCAKSLAAQCICVCVYGFVCLWVCYHDNSKLIACFDLHQTGSVCEGSDHLKLIKFCPSCALRKGVCGRVKIFGSALLQPVCSVCVTSECFFHFMMCFCCLPARYSLFVLKVPLNTNQLTNCTLKQCKRVTVVGEDK